MRIYAQPPGSTFNRELGRAKLAALNLTADEALMIVDSLNGVILTALSFFPGEIAMTLEDALHYADLSAAWPSVDSAELLRRLDALSADGAIALADAVDGFRRTRHHTDSDRLRWHAMLYFHPEWKPSKATLSVLLASPSAEIRERAVVLAAGPFGSGAPGLALEGESDGSRPET